MIFMMNLLIIIILISLFVIWIFLRMASITDARSYSKEINKKKNDK